jgi:putative SOS response-associated peptidase YedK
VCGRFAFFSPADAVAALFGAGNTADAYIAGLPPRYNIAPTQHVFACRHDVSGNIEATALRWGLIPFWAKEASIGQRMINARAETVAEKPAYRAAFRHRRCVVLADGFYEWRKTGSAKTPYYISLDSGDAFAFGGLWESWTDKVTGEIVESTTLITRPANDFMQPLHHRMPMILTPDTTTEWLEGDVSLLSAEPPELKAWSVDRRVNNARNDGADLIEPVDDPLLVKRD